MKGICICATLSYEIGIEEQAYVQHRVSLKCVQCIKLHAYRVIIRVLCISAI